MTEPLCVAGPSDPSCNSMKEPLFCGTESKRFVISRAVAQAIVSNRCQPPVARKGSSARTRLIQRSNPQSKEQIQWHALACRGAKMPRQDEDSIASGGYEGDLALFSWTR